MSNTYLGSGFYLAYGVTTSGTTTYTSINGLTSFTLPSRSTADVDITTLASKFKRSRAGLPDPGSSNFTMNYDPDDAGYKFLDGLAAAFPQPDTTFVAVIQDANNLMFSATGFITSFAPDDETPGEKISVTGTIRWTSYWTVFAGTAPTPPLT